MKNLLLISVSILLLSCSQQDRKSEREKQIDTTKEIVMKFFNAQSEGNIETMKYLISDDFQYTLNGQLDISNTYYGWDEFLKFMGEFGTLLKGSVGVEFIEIIPSENTAIIFAEGRMEGVAGKYENEYALKYTLNKDGRITTVKEYLSDLLLAQKLYGQDLCGAKSSQKE
jgi:ketosteroid isomerase-like protein